VKTLALGRSAAVLLLASALAGCSPKRTGTSSAPAPPASVGADDGTGAQLPFIENDYGLAVSEARARRVPLFVDAWAPWCHTCLSMRSYVFSDARLKPLSTRLVWLALDTERAENAPIVARLGVKVLPTLLVIDPLSERTRIAHEGSLTAPELAALLESDEAGASPEATAERIARLADGKQLGACVTAGADEAGRMPPGTPLADVLRAAIACAIDLPAGAPERARLPELVDAGERVVSDASQPILADDRSDLYDYVLDGLRGLGRDDDAKRLATAWVAFLEDQAARAPTPAARAVFDAHRLLAYEAIGEPARAVPMLEQSERDFPADYNPPARLGKAFLDMKRDDDAVAAVERALARAYGPRKLRLWSLEADALVAKGDTEGARRALQSALAFATTVPLTGAYPSLRDAIAERLKGL
jgi:tetratricopeptide (TPR) repeat protein